MKKSWARVLWLGPLILLLEIALRPVSEPDIFFYLALVRKYLDTGIWPTVDPFLSTAGQSLHSLHQWLGYWFFYGSYQLMGWTGPELLKTAVLLLLFSLPLLWLKRAGGAIPTLFPYLWAATIFSSHHRFRERASLFGDLSAEVLLGGLLFFRDRRWFWRCLPLLFLFWAQVHPSFPLGFVILLIFVATHFDEVVKFKRWPWILASLTAPLLNPLGIEGFLYPWKFALESEPYLRQHVMEWLPLWDVRIRPYLFLYVPFFTLLPYMIYQFSRLKIRHQLFEVALSILLLVMMIKSARFGMTGQLLLLVLIAHMSRLIGPSLENRRVWISVPIGILAIMFFKIGHSPYLSRPFADRFGLDSNEMPVEAAEKLKSLDPQMKVFNSFKYGGYLAWAWQGNPAIFFHGFSTDFGFYEKNYLSPQDSAQALGDLIAREGLGVFFLTKTSNDADLIRLVSERPDWQVIHQDAESLIFALRDPRVFKGPKP